MATLRKSRDASGIAGRPLNVQQVLPSDYFADKLRDWVKAQGNVGCTELANLTGATKSMVSKWLNGKVNPSQEYWDRLAKVMGYKSWIHVFRR